jgi:hypothetical protein
MRLDHGTTRGNAVREGNADRDTKKDPEPERVRASRDQIEYIADLLLELKEMARSQRLSTLAGLLQLAHTEARLRAKDRH